MTFVSKENFKAGDSWLGGGGGGPVVPKPLQAVTYVYDGTDWTITGGDPVTGPGTGIMVLLTSEMTPPAVILGASDDPTNHAGTVGDVRSYGASVKSIRGRNGHQPWSAFDAHPDSYDLLAVADSGSPERIVVGIYSDVAGTVVIKEHSVQANPTLREGEDEDEPKSEPAKKAPAKKASKRSK